MKKKIFKTTLALTLAFIMIVANNTLVFTNANPHEHQPTLNFSYSEQHIWNSLSQEDINSFWEVWKAYSTSTHIETPCKFDTRIDGLNETVFHPIHPLPLRKDGVQRSSVQDWTEWSQDEFDTFRETYVLPPHREITYEYLEEIVRLVDKYFDFLGYEFNFRPSYKSELPNGNTRYESGCSIFEFKENDCVDLKEVLSEYKNYSYFEYSIISCRVGIRARNDLDYTDHQRLVVLLSTFDIIQTNLGNLGDIVTAIQIAELVRNEADIIYPDGNWAGTQWMRNDAYRHFVWSLRLARATNIDIARIITNNFEYAMLLFGEYNTNLANGMSEVAALDLVLRERSRVADYAAISNAHFQRIFSSDYIMDFWNNWAGFTFSDRAMHHNNAFYDAEERGILILSECFPQINDNRVTILRNSGEWRHFR